MFSEARDRVPGAHLECEPLIGFFYQELVSGRRRALPGRPPERLRRQQWRRRAFADADPHANGSHPDRITYAGSNNRTDLGSYPESCSDARGDRIADTRTDRHGNGSDKPDADPEAHGQRVTYACADAHRDRVCEHHTHCDGNLGADTHRVAGSNRHSNHRRIFPR